jgi:hypothetical protein
MAKLSTKITQGILATVEFSLQSQGDGFFRGKSICNVKWIKLLDANLHIRKPEYIHKC